MASSSHSFPDHDQQTDPSYSAENVGVTEDIFLSHSGQQKLFVGYLHADITRANRTAFFDKLSLPKASAFPDRIKRAARGCKLGVLVLSNEFVTSKWPMLELEIMVERRIDLLPLFYSLSPEDLKCSQKLSEWQSAWKDLVEDENQSKKWEEAVRKLRSYNGELLKRKGDEFDYIEKVVTAICTLVPPRATYNLYTIEGHQYMAKVPPFY